MEGFHRAAPTDLLGAALIVLAALLVMTLFAAPMPGGVASALQRVIFRIRARAGQDSRHASAWRRLGMALTSVTRDCLPPAGIPALADALVCSVFAALPFGQYLVASQLDVGLLFVAGATSLAVSALIASGSAWRGVRAAGQVVWQHVPAAAAIASVVLTTGSLRVQEIERTQGGWPWDWLAFRHPAALAAFVLLLATGNIAFDGPERPTDRALEALVEQERDSAHPARGVWLETACRTHRLIVAGLASALFLGGWLLPGVPAATQDAHPWLELAGAALLLAKTGVVVLALGVARAFGPRLSLGSARATLVRRIPLAMVALGATAAWSWWGPGRAVQMLVSGGLVAAAALALLALGQRLKQGVEAPEARLSPFL